jgi:hypothetical protein
VHCANGVPVLEGGGRQGVHFESSPPPSRSCPDCGQVHSSYHQNRAFQHRTALLTRQSTHMYDTYVLASSSGGRFSHSGSFSKVAPEKWTAAYHPYSAYHSNCAYLPFMNSLQILGAPRHLKTQTLKSRCCQCYEESMGVATRVMLKRKPPWVRPVPVFGCA